MPILMPSPTTLSKNIESISRNGFHIDDIVRGSIRYDISTILSKKHQYSTISPPAYPPSPAPDPQSSPSPSHASPAPSPISGPPASPSRPFGPLSSSPVPIPVPATPFSLGPSLSPVPTSPPPPGPVTSSSSPSSFSPSSTSLSIQSPFKNNVRTTRIPLHRASSLPLTLPSLTPSNPYSSPPVAPLRGNTSPQRDNWSTKNSCPETTGPRLRTLSETTPLLSPLLDPSPMKPVDDSLTSLQWLSGVNVGQILEGKPMQSPASESTPIQHADDTPQTPTSSASDSKTGAKETKPPYSYAALIIMAMKSTSSCKMTLSEIYKWISDNFVYYKNIEPTWQNSIRHNLSLNKCFLKIPRAKGDPGKGGYWSIVPELAEKLLENSIRKRRASVYDFGGGGGRDMSVAKKQRVDVIVQNQWCNNAQNMKSNISNIKTNDDVKSNNMNNHKINVNNNTTRISNNNTESDTTSMSNNRSSDSKHADTLLKQGERKDEPSTQNTTDMSKLLGKNAWPYKKKSTTKSKDNTAIVGRTSPQEKAGGETKRTTENTSNAAQLRPTNSPLSSSSSSSSSLSSSSSSSSSSSLPSTSIDVLTTLEHCNIEHAYGKSPVVDYDVTDEENIRAIATELEETSSNAAASCSSFLSTDDPSTVLPVTSAHAHVAMRSDCIWSSDDSSDLVESMAHVAEELLEARDVVGRCSDTNGLLHTLQSALETCEGALTASMFVTSDGDFAGELEGLGEGRGHLGDVGDDDVQRMGKTELRCLRERERRLMLFQQFNQSVAQGLKDDVKEEPLSPETLVEVPVSSSSKC